MAKKLSRADRWAEACAKVQSLLPDLRTALEDLDEIRQEYEEWRDSLPDNAQSGPTYDKLEEVADLSIFDPLDDFESAIEDFASADLPIGFGRD